MGSMLEQEANTATTGSHRVQRIVELQPSYNWTADLFIEKLGVPYRIVFPKSLGDGRQGNLRIFAQRGSEHVQYKYAGVLTARDIGQITELARQAIGYHTDAAIIAELGQARKTFARYMH